MVAGDDMVVVKYNCKVPSLASQFTSSLDIEVVAGHLIGTSGKKCNSRSSSTTGDFYDQQQQAKRNVGQKP